MPDGRRALKTTSRQFAIMVDFIANNKRMLNAKYTPDFTAEDREELWAKLTKLLNADRWGPMKPVAKWKKTWSDYKCEVKKKIAKNKRRQRKTQGGPPPEDLPPLYKKAAEIIQETGRKNVEDGSQVLKEKESEQLIMQIDDDTSHILSAEQPNITELVNAENNKVSAINAVAAAIERSNEIQKEKNEIVKERNKIENERNEIERERNVILDNAADILLNLFLQFKSKT